MTIRAIYIPPFKLILYFFRAMEEARIKKKKKFSGKVIEREVLDETCRRGRR